MQIPLNLLVEPKMWKSRFVNYLWWFMTRDSVNGQPATHWHSSLKPYIYIHRNLIGSTIYNNTWNFGDGHRLMDKSVCRCPWSFRGGVCGPHISRHVASISTEQPASIGCHLVWCWSGVNSLCIGSFWQSGGFWRLHYLILVRFILYCIIIECPTTDKVPHRYRINNNVICQWIMQDLIFNLWPIM